MNGRGGKRKWGARQVVTGRGGRQNVGEVVYFTQDGHRASAEGDRDNKAKYPEGEFSEKYGTHDFHYGRKCTQKSRLGGS